MFRRITFLDKGVPVHRFVVLFAVLALVVGVGAAAADPPSPEDAAGRSNDILGVVPAQAFAPGGGGGKGGNNLVYHGGPVMLTNRTVPIYWGPSSGFGAGYQSTIDQYFSDVAAASGQNTNVYSVLDQYYNSLNQFIAYSSSAGGAVTDTSGYANDCSDTVSATTVCVSDAQIRAAVQRNVPNPDPNTVYFVFTGKNVGSCYNSSTCAFSYYCAYHSSFSSGGKTWIYANQPYADTVPGSCDAGYHPNGNDADATINVASHEHREAINDPFGNAWYDRRGYEGSDKCAWNFGSLTGPDYNQTINGHHYILQQEWSNAISGCALHG
jgi:hypothetical protein